MAGENENKDDTTNLDNAIEDKTDENTTDADTTTDDKSATDIKAEDKSVEGKTDDSTKDDTDEGGEGDSDNKTLLMIPKSRYDSAQQQRRAAESKLQKYEQEAAKQEAATTVAVKSTAVEDMDTQLAEIDASISQAQLDGDTDLVVKLSGEARVLERNMFTVIAKEEAAQAGTAAQENGKLDTLIEVLEAEYDILNPANEKFDKDITAEVLDLQTAFVARGDTPAVAMLKAVGYVLPEERVKDEIAAKRNTNVEKNLDAAKRIPASTTDIGNDSATGGVTTDTPDVTNMSEAEFDALPESTLQRLRGDAG